MHTSGLRHGVMPTKPVISPWRRLINTSKVMTIAVADNGTAWSAPVYYLFDEKRFYFFSNPSARHIKLSKNAREGASSGLSAASNGLDAASIFQDDADIKNLAGIQMSGTILKSPLNARSVSVAKKYCRHFKISGNPMDILGFFASKFHAGLYFFEPDRVYYMDNSMGFGSRETVAL